MSINEEAVEAGAIALYEDGRGDDYRGDPAYDWPNIDSGYDWDGDFDDDGPVDQPAEWLRDRYRSEVRTALAAALPLLRLSDVPGLERQPRDKIAGEEVERVEYGHVLPDGGWLFEHRGIKYATHQRTVRHRLGEPVAIDHWTYVDHRHPVEGCTHDRHDLTTAADVAARLATRGQESS